MAWRTYSVVPVRLEHARNRMSLPFCAAVCVLAIE